MASRCAARCGATCRDLSVARRRYPGQRRQIPTLKVSRCMIHCYRSASQEGVWSLEIKKHKCKVENRTGARSPRDPAQNQHCNRRPFS